MSRVVPVRLGCALLAVTAFTACTSAAPDVSSPASGGRGRPAVVDSAGSDGAGDPYYPQDGNGGYDVADYAVSLSYDPGTKVLDGDTTVTASADERLARFNLDLNGFEVSEVTVDGEPARFERSGEHELVVVPARPVAAKATFRTRVRYSGTPQAADDGSLGAGGWQESASGGAFAAGEPHAASFWYPANDHPADKATFHLSARVPDGWGVVSNGLEQPPVSADGWTTFAWADTNRLTTYSSVIAIDRWTYERGTLPDGVPYVNAYAPGVEDKKDIQARMPDMIDFLSARFGRYPQVAAGGIYLNENIGFSLETQGRPVYAKWAEQDVVVHELSHQWFGDWVSIDSWADICLNECLASYAQWLWDEQENGADLDDRFRTAVARGTGRLWSGALYDMGTGHEFDAVYDKGPLAMHALRRQVGDDVFDRALRQWVTEHRDGNASWPQFEALVTRLSGQDLRGFLDAWFRSDSKPADVYLYPGTLAH